MECRGNRRIVLEAVKKCGYALQFASTELRNSYQVVLEAVRENGEALQFASAELNDNEEIVLAAVQEQGRVLRLVSTEFRNNQRVVLAAVQQDGLALKYASHRLQLNQDAVLAAVNNDGFSLKYTSDEYKGNQAIVLAAVRSNHRALRFATEPLWSNMEVASVSMEGAIQRNDHTYVNDDDTDDESVDEETPLYPWNEPLFETIRKRVLAIELPPKEARSREMSPGVFADCWLADITIADRIVRDFCEYKGCPAEVADHIFGYDSSKINATELRSCSRIIAAVSASKRRQWGDWLVGGD